MGENWQNKTKGNELRMNFGNGRNHIFVAGSEDMGYESQNITFLNGEVEFADKTKAYAIIGISENDGGEHFQTIVFVPNGSVVDQDDPDFLEKLGKTKDQVYGYRYRYFPEWKRNRDHHVDYRTGWSG